MESEKISSGVRNEVRTEIDTDRSPSVSDTVRKKQRMAGEKICRVCGDKAVAHNFDVITCESCKTFFRRNARKTQKECMFEGRCEITVPTRRFCPACRLQKCFEIGMRADMILDEVERQTRMAKILTNRKKRQEAAKKDNSGTIQSDRQQFPDTSFEPTQQATEESDAVAVPILDASNNSSTAVTSFPRYNGLTVQTTTATSSRDDVRATCNGVCSTNNSSCSCSNSNVNKQHGVKKARSGTGNFQHVPQCLLPSDPRMYWRLTPEEHCLITELTVAYKEALLKMPSASEMLTVQLEKLSLKETLAYCDNFAPELINFLKKVPDFRALEMNDQQALLKANAMMFLILKGSASFSEEREAWLKDFGALPVDVFARITQQQDVVQRYADFCRCLKRILKNDCSAYVLTNCWVLFEPQAPNVIDRQQVNSYQDKYYLLLKHYLQSQYSYVFAAQYQEAIEDSIYEGKAVSTDMVLMFSNWKDLLQPLLIEVMNLA